MQWLRHLVLLLPRPSLPALLHPLLLLLLLLLLLPRQWWRLLWHQQALRCCHPPLVWGCLPHLLRGHGQRKWLALAVLVALVVLVGLGGPLVPSHPHRPVQQQQQQQQLSVVQHPLQRRCPPLQLLAL